MRPVTRGLSVDVLVVGSGASGLAAALSARRAGARVALVTKDSLQSSNSAKAQGGIQAAVGADDSPELHAGDVWRSSHETADLGLVEALTSEGPAAIHWLEHHGVTFTRQNGGYRLARCGRARPPRRRPGGARTRPPNTTALRNALNASGATALPGHPLVALRRTENGLVVTCRPKGGEEVEVTAGAVVLAAGGRCFREAELRGELSTNHPGATGEATELALELGARARDLDALQYHPTGGAWPAGVRGYSIPETTRAYGATLLNAARERFVDELAPRDVVAEAILREIGEGRGAAAPDGRSAVWLDTTRIARADAELSLPYMLRRYRAAGVDPLAEPILAHPVLHYQNGGLVIDVLGRTTVEGLYACGEIAGGTHGRNRMMGNSLLECVVFGRRAGAAAAEKARS